jgi:hypothetical protein
MTTRVGETYQARFEVWSAATPPVLATADSTLVTVTKPDGTLVTPNPTATQTTTGVYDWGFVPTLVGRHEYVVRVTLGGVTRDLDADALNVEDATTWAPLVSTRQAKEALNIPLSDTSNDEELRRVIVMASGAVEGETRLWHRVTAVERFPSSSPILMLDSLPVRSITSVVQGATTFGVSAYRLNPTGTGIIAGVGVVPAPWLSGDDDVVVTVEAGATAVPAPVQQATILTIIDMWAGTQRGPTALPLQGEGEPLPPSPDYAVPSPARVLLRPWLKPPGSA